MFDSLSDQLHATAVAKGFWEPAKQNTDIFITKQLMMIVSEAVEVMEAIRKDKGREEIADEVADIIIRTLDLYSGLVEYGYTDVSLDYALDKKANINKDRAERHGVRF